MKLLFILLFQISFLYGQAAVDSIMNSISHLPDTAKINRLGDICFQNRYKDQNLAILCGEKGIEIARAIGNKKLEARLLNITGVCYRILGDYTKSLNYFFIALREFDESKDSVEMGFAENNIGTNYLIKSYYTVALEHIKKGLEIFRKVNNKGGMAYCTKALGDIYVKQCNYEKALIYYDSTYLLRKDIKYDKGVYTAILKIADVYAVMKQYDVALAKYAEAEKGFLEVGEHGAVASTCEKTAVVYIELKDYDKALIYATKAYNLAQKYNTITSLIENGKNIGVIYTHLKRFDEAEKMLTSSLALARKHKDNMLTLECFQAFSDFYKEKGDLSSALKFARLESEIKDSIMMQESIAGAGEMETIYDSEKEMRERAMLQKNIELAESQRNYWIIITLLLVVISLVIYWKFQFKKRANQKLYELNAMKDKFFSIISHDLKNPFHGLIGLSSILLDDIEKKDFDKLITHAKLIHSSSEQGYNLLINLLEWSRSQTGKMKVEIKEVNLKDLIYNIVELVMPASMEKKISVGITVDENLNCITDENILNTVIRNLLSNAVKYTNLSGKIKIKAFQENEKVLVSVEDNGTGIKDDDKQKLFRIDGSFSTPGTKNEKGTGLGLILCKDFVEKLGGSIWVESEFGKGTKFTFSIPIAAKA